MGRGTMVCFKDDGSSWMRSMAVNSTATSFPTIENTLTKPTKVEGSHFMLPSGQYTDLALSFFGTGSENDTFDFRLVGWSKVTAGTGGTAQPVWKPYTILRGTATLSTSVGVADGVQAATERDADTIVAGSPVITTSLYTIYSPADNTPAFLILNALDFEMIGVYFDLNGSATGANAFARWIQG